MKNLILFLMLLGMQKSYGAHLWGQAMYYEVLSVDGNLSKVKISADLYRDALGSGAFFDGVIYCGIYINDFTTGKYQYLFTENIPLLYHNPLNVGENSSMPIMEKGYYSKEFIIDNRGEYILSYQRCCKTEVINNILNPGTVGSAVILQVSAGTFNTVHAGPKPKLMYEKLLALNKLNDVSVECSVKIGNVKYNLTNVNISGGLHEQNGGDPRSCDGVLPNPQLCPPPYQVAKFKEGFAYDHPFGVTASTFSFDNITGLMEVTPTVIGVYNFESKIEHEVNGKILSTTYINWSCQVQERVMPKVVIQKYVDTNGNNQYDKSDKIVNDVPYTIEKFNSIINDDENNGRIILYGNMGDKYTLKSNSDRYYFDEKDAQIIIDQNSKYKAVKVYEKSTVGLNDKTEIELGIYPNPASTTAQINTSSEMKNIKIYNTSGMIVYTQNAQGKTSVIDTQLLPQGIYYVKVQTTDNYEAKGKLVKN
jgi:hypothetical protein